MERLSLIIAIVLLAAGSFYFLDRSDKQARDTIRKHHLEDMERSLYFAKNLHGEFPPYGQATWCGVLNASQNTAVKQEVEEALRAQNTKYANQAKPFPSDPKYANTPQDYFYWKRSPTLMELYARLEAQPTGEKNSTLCENATHVSYDYGITSVNREDTLGVPQ